MGKKKPPQLYVYRCIKNQGKNIDFGLSDKKYKIGDYVSSLGNPVSSLYEATTVNPKKEGWYDLRSIQGNEIFDEYFECCCIDLSLKQRHLEIGKGVKIIK